jgi:hypothetical protein
MARWEPRQITRRWGNWSDLVQPAYWTSGAHDGENPLMIIYLFIYLFTYLYIIYIYMWSMIYIYMNMFRDLFWVCLSCFWRLCLPWKPLKSMKHCTKQYKTYQHMAFRSCRVSSCYGRWCKKWQVPGSGDASSLPLVVTPPVGRTCDASSFRPCLGGFNLFWSVLQLLQLICCCLQGFFCGISCWRPKSNSS